MWQKLHNNQLTCHQQCPVLICWNPRPCGMYRLSLHVPFSHKCMGQCPRAASGPVHCEVCVQYKACIIHEGPTAGYSLNVTAAAVLGRSSHHLATLATTAKPCTQPLVTKLTGAGGPAQSQMYVLSWQKGMLTLWTRLHRKELAVLLVTFGLLDLLKVCCR